MSLRRAGALLGLLLVLVVGVSSARQVLAGGPELTLSDAAALKGDWPMAISHARAAAEAFAPGSPWPERAWQRLEAIGHDAEARGDDETALLAYGAMRAAALATRGPLTRWQTHRAHAEEGLARVAASERDPRGRRETAASMLDALQESEPPATWLLAVLAAAAVGMLGGFARLAWLGPEAASARVPQVLTAVSLAAYAAIILTR
jgi:hypothetical protein